MFEKVTSKLKKFLANCEEVTTYYKEVTNLGSKVTDHKIKV